MKKYNRHTTHYVCNEILKRDGGKAIGCCCTGHECKEKTPLTLEKIMEEFDEEYGTLWREAGAYTGLKGSRFVGGGYMDVTSDLKEYIKSSIKDALEAVRVPERIPVENPSLEQVAREYGWDLNTTQYDENVKKFLGDYEE